MNDAPVRDSDAAPQLTALNGMRFFAVFHIFLYHLWSIRFESPRQEGAWADAYANMDSFPAWFNHLIAHGYLSTSFFFLLWLMRVLSKLSRGRQIALLVASPAISLVPTLIFQQFFPDGGKGSQN
jgi:hypothetical protein